MAAQFTLSQARQLLPDVRSHAEGIIALRAELAEAQMALQRGDDPPGGLAQAKAVEAHLQQAIDWFTDAGIDVKGIAPLIIDFPSELDGQPVLLCWLEGETELGWYHRPEVGFMGRRRL